MAGAVLRFSNGYLGFERCEDPTTKEQYIRAVIYSGSTGRMSSDSVTLKQVFEFATEAVKQALLADGHSEAELQNLSWVSDGARLANQ